LSPPDLTQIEVDLGTGRSMLLELLTLLERERSVVRVASDLYFLAEALDHMKARVREHFAKTSALTPAGFRELFGTSRKYTIPLLEYLDREGVTMRAGEVRRLRERRGESTA
jgi:selenocysteine-specific elongation factor